jgi:hypothetical protein
MNNESLPTTFQRIENISIALLSLLIYARLGFAWYWLPVLFIAFDLSALGYALGPRIGAMVYNAVHNYLVPVGALLLGYAMGNVPQGLLFVCLVWIFHIAVDRVMGYGLKYPDKFEHTHLGMIGKARSSKE